MRTGVTPWPLRTLIKDNLADLAKRPTLMILTGDQIYADDILWAMWSHTSNMAQKIMGYDETDPSGRLSRSARSTAAGTCSARTGSPPTTARTI